MKIESNGLFIVDIELIVIIAVLFTSIIKLYDMCLLSPVTCCPLQFKYVRRPIFK